MTDESWRARSLNEPTMTLRTFLALRTMMAEPGTNIFLALEAVSSVAIEHPEWDLDERKTWSEWERSRFGPR